MEGIDASSKKMKQLALLKFVHGCQLSRLQQKLQLDLELLDDLRSFSRHRSVIEKMYAQSLCKLVQQLLAKRPYLVTAETDQSNADDAAPNRALLDVWKATLAQTDRVAKARLSAAETYLQRVSDPCKLARTSKAQTAKTVFEQLVEVQRELMVSAQEVCKAQRLFRDEEQLAQDARLKAQSADSKVKNKAVGLFTSLAKLQQQSAKLNALLEACETKSTAARNDYLLNLAAANAHLVRYYSADIPDLTATLDGDLHEKVARLLALLAEAEVRCSNLTTDCFSIIHTDSNKVLRQFEHDCFMRENPVLREVVQIPMFVPHSIDNTRGMHVSREFEGEVELNKQARTWAIRVARESHSIKLNSRRLNELTEKTDTPQLGSLELMAFQVRCDQLKVAIRKSETERAKAEGRLGALRLGGIDVDDWLNSALADPKYNGEEEEPLGGEGEVEGGPEDPEDVLAEGGGSPSPPATGVRTEIKLGSLDKENRAQGLDSGLGGDLTPADHRGSNPLTYIRYPDEIDYSSDRLDGLVNRVNQSNNSTLNKASYPLWCVALYDYTAANSDELTLKENENLELTGEGEGDGWLRARNAAGHDGLVPENYIRVWDPADDEDGDEINVDDGLPPGNPPPRAPGGPDAPEGGISADTVALRTKKSVDAEGGAGDQMATPPLWVRALYDYEAMGEGELSFTEGQLIRVIALPPRDGVDDGWWEGEVGGGVRGVFPSMVVEPVGGGGGGEQVRRHSMTCLLEAHRSATSAEFSAPGDEYSSSEELRAVGDQAHFGSMGLIARGTPAPHRGPGPLRGPPTFAASFPQISYLLNDGSESVV